MIVYDKFLIVLKTTDREEENSMFLESEKYREEVKQAVGGGAVIRNRDLSTDFFSTFTDVMSDFKIFHWLYLGRKLKWFCLEESSFLTATLTLFNPVTSSVVEK